MGLFRSMGARKDATRGTAAIEVRKGLEGLFTGPGVLPGGTSPLVAGTAGWAYTVNAAHFVTKRAAGDGVHLFGNDGPVTVGATGVGMTVPAAPSSGLSRIDIIWVRHRSANENNDTTSEPDFGVAVGAAGSPGLAPTLPPGALELARNTMTASATTTASAGNTIAQTAPVALMRGQQVPEKGVRAAAATLGINAWGIAAAIPAYPFQAGGWYLINAVGSVSTGGTSATLKHRVRAENLEVSAEFSLTATPNVAYSLAGHLLFQASITATVQVLHEVILAAPGTGIVVVPGHTVSVARVA